MNDLVLDPLIRIWVFLPTVIITFLIGILRHYILMNLSTEKNLELQQFHDGQILLRSTLLRENSGFIPRSSFLMRRHFFNNKETGYLTPKSPPATQNIMTDPNMMTDMLKGNAANVLPTIVIGTWLNCMLSGFITTRVPFPLTLRFKPMLQREIELIDLDASWVSSASWYFLNVFGLRSVFTLVLGENNAADEALQMQEQMSGAALAVPLDSKLAFKTEWEALEINNHEWVLNEIEYNIIEELNSD